MAYQLGIIGAGNIAEAIVRGALAAGVFPAEQVIVSDPTRARRELFTDMGCATSEDNAAVVGASRRILLAVKPQMFGNLGDVLDGADENALVISIMAGIRITKIAALCPAGVGVVRVMPNTPLLVGCGMSGIAADASVGDDDRDWCTKLFEAAGAVVHVDEPLIDAVTAVSGSGPAYVFYLTEAMTQAGVDLGLSPDQAGLLARQTILGAGRMMSKTGVDPAELRRRVTSPNGTTQAAIELMDAHRVRALIQQAVQAAAGRSEELGRDS